MENELTKDEKMVLSKYRQVRAKGHGDIDIAVKDGKLVKLWSVDKEDLKEVIEESEQKIREIGGIK